VNLIGSSVAIMRSPIQLGFDPRTAHSSCCAPSEDFGLWERYCVGTCRRRLSTLALCASLWG